MKTEIIKVNSKNLRESIKKAAEIIKSGDVVVFPTETVYGLGANALNESAVKKIFEAKGRPADNPLIVHISDVPQLKSITSQIPLKAKKLMEVFWPGPLSIVLKKSKNVPDVVTAGLDSVAVRMPSNKIALELIRMSGFPIAAPSANTSTRPSPTSAKHVYEDLNGKVPLILDGGDCEVGLESTVISLVTKIPLLLRPGKITPSQIEKVIGKIEVHSNLKDKISYEKVPASPGMKYKHYSPHAQLILITPKRDFKVEFEKLNLIGKVGVLSFSKKFGVKNEVNFNSNLEKMAHGLFKEFREFDEKGFDYIVVEGVSEEGLGLALMNRLKKASSKII